MRWPKLSIGSGPGDFLPLLIGGIMLLMSVPAFIALLVDPDQRWGVLRAPVFIVLGTGILFGLGFLVLGVRLCSSPGSWLYRLSHGRIFSR